ncbi:MAG: hypothetical protein HC800_09690 [Phormidesmis sp. RL_2_1]|nr:hypothetical protein [Phormidesmis sp. RL_2_1]
MRISTLLQVPEATDMYNNSKRDWLGSFVVAALGAGVITSFAVSQGQSPLEGLGITAIAALAAVAIDCLL